MGLFPEFPDIHEIMIRTRAQIKAQMLLEAAEMASKYGLLRMGSDGHLYLDVAEEFKALAAKAKGEVPDVQP